jgi:diguanylate cyclase (GGDEF)-like protein/PAS domain S-box-containing protein
MTRQLTRFGLATVTRKAGDGHGPDSLTSLSQRKLNALGLPLAYVDGSRRYRFANKAFIEWTGRPFAKVIGYDVEEVVGRDAYPLYEAYVEAALAGERTGFERQLTTPGRPSIWIRVDYYPDRGTDGDVRGFLVTYADVDQLKRLELEAGWREHRLRLVTDSVGSPIVHFDRNLKVRFANKPFGNWIGVAPDDLLGRAVKELIAGGTFAEMDEHIGRAFSGGKVSFERRERKSTGELRWVRITLFPDRAVGGHVGGVFAVMTDIEDDIAIRDALRAQEGQLRLIADNIPGPIAYLDGAATYTFVNQAFANWVRRPADQIYGRTPFEVLAPDVASFLRPVLERAQGGENIEYERVDAPPDGERRWVHGRVAPDLDANGTLRGLYCTEYDIHDLKLTEQALAAREEQLRLFTDNIPDPVVYLDTDRRHVFVNEAFLQLNGLDRAAVIGKTLVEVMGVDAMSTLATYYDRAFAGETVSYERELVDATGRPRWIRGRMVADHRIDGAIQGVYVVGHDITDLKRSEDALRRANWELSSHIDNTPLAVLEWDRDFRLVRWSPQAERLFGWRAEEVLGMPIDGNPLLHEADRGAVAELLARLMSGEEPRTTGLTRNTRKDGETIWCEWYHSCLLDDRGNIVSILSFVQDVSLRIRAEERLQHMATRDALTGLPNRVLLQERLAQAIALAKRNARRVGVLFIDLDRFKNVNDTLGHRIGDELLKEVSRALSLALREVDLLARLGGDEFMVVVEDFDEPAVLARIAQKLLEAVAHPFRIEEHDIYVTSSIGISVYPDDSDDPEELLKHADVAMYRAKELGRNTFQFLDANLAQHRLRQHALETALRAALKANRLELHYQPILAVADRSVIGAEALLRWNDPEHGSVPPKVFIALAEESGLIHSLGEWVLRTAAEQCVAWRRAGLALNVSVNLSGRQFYRDDIAQRILDIVRAAGCEPSWIELEVTETSLLHDLDAIRKALHVLRNDGFTVAIDDFGTGYSSLTHLKHFPIDTLKIDISFIADLETDPGDAAITEAIIGLARGLGLRVVAEGVGTKAQLEFLAARGCHCFQGYWASRPVPAADFEGFIRSRLVRVA